MNTDDIVENYYDYLESKTEIYEDPIDECLIMSFPYLDMYNDYIDIYLKKKNGLWTISDGGETLGYLLQAGVKDSVNNLNYISSKALTFNFNFTKDKEIELSEIQEDKLSEKIYQLMEIIVGFRKRINFPDK